MSIAVPLYGFGASGGTGGSLTVTAPANVTVTVSKGGKTKTKNSGVSGVAVFKGLKSGTWTVTITDGEQTASKSVDITTDYSVLMSFSTIPSFTYTGDYEIVDDDDNPITVSDGNWKIRFLTSGTLTFTELNGAENGIDVFLVGGGGNGSDSYWNPDSSMNMPGAGGGGGYTATNAGVSVQLGKTYQIVVGSAGGNTTAFSFTAACGKNATKTSRGWADGGDGGSGGGGCYGTGGTDGADGVGSTYTNAGKGQGTTTREFGDANGTLYSTGGDGGKGTAGKQNTGNGGAGAKNDGSSGGSGGSGIVIIRNAREAA